jgi:hypothetical protein
MECDTGNDNKSEIGSDVDGEVDKNVLGLTEAS